MDSSEETLDRPNRGRHLIPRILASGAVGEPETTVPASPQDLIAVGIADVDAPPTIVVADDEVPEWGALLLPPDSNMFAPLADVEIAEVARRDHGGIQSRSDHAPVVAMDVNDSESEVSMGTALEQDLAVSPWDVAQAEFQNLQRRVQDGDHDAPRESERTDVWRHPSRRVAPNPGSEGGTPRRSRTGLIFPVQCQQAVPTVVPGSGAM